MRLGAMTLGRLLGIAILAIGVALVFLPEQIATLLARPYATAGERINMRASWGGVVTGVGLLLVWLPHGDTAPSARPRRRFTFGLIMWLMIGIASGRAVGFAIDGSPDTLQWVWMIAEIVIATGCAVALRKKPSGAAETS